MKIGKYTYGDKNIKTYSWGEGSELKIGAFCSIAEDIKVFLGGNHNSNWITTYPFGHINKDTFNKFNGVGHPKTKGDVIIGNDVWIGNSVTIMSGVIIGDGAIIANNSHVVKNVNPYEIVGGNPAKLIKKRFNDEEISKLLKIKWWDFDNNKINEISPLLCSSSLEDFFNFCESK